MQCEEAIELISTRMDGELKPDDAHRLDAHLAGCAECRATAEAMSLQDAQLVRAFAPRRVAAVKVGAQVVAEHVHGRRRWANGWITLGAAAAGFALAVIVMHGSTKSGAPGPVAIATTPIAQLDIATGPVECMRPEDSTWQRLATGGALPAGSRVRTGAGVRCEFAMADGSEVRMNENSELELKRSRTVAVADGQVFSSVAKNKMPFT